MPTKRQRTVRRRMPRRSKVAHLPRAVRAGIVARLVDGYSRRAVIRWLNKLPAVRAALKREQSGRFVFRITDNNISQWLQSNPPEAEGVTFS